MALFESYERRINQIMPVLEKYGIKSIEECREICKAKGFDPYEITENIQKICFELKRSHRCATFKWLCRRALCRPIRIN